MLKFFVTLFVIINFSNQPSLANEGYLEQFIHPTPFEVQDIKFKDPEGNIHSLNSSFGKVILINFWATWCKPCVKEMPSIAKIQKEIGKENFIVIPISLDFRGPEVIERFYKKYNINNLPIYLDDKGKASKLLKVRALPTSIIISKDGLEIVRVLGDYDWSSREASNYITHLINNTNAD